MLFLFRTRSDGWDSSDRLRVRDFLLSLAPKNFWETIFLLSNLFQWGIAVQAFRSNGGMAFGVYGMACGAALLAFLLRLEAYLPIEIGVIAGRYIFLPHSPFFVAQALADFLIASSLLFGTGRNIFFFRDRVYRRMRPKGFPARKPGRHRILLIEPAIDDDLRVMSLRRIFYPTTSPYLAALVPEDWDVMILDQIFDEIDYDIDVDVVGITTMAHRYKEFCAIAERFRRKGVCVLLGGPEISRRPEKYQDHCDSLLVGEADGFFPRMLEDWKNTCLKKQYINPEVFNLHGMPTPRYDLLPQRRYFNTYNILVSTSCPYHCEFCSYNRTQKPRLRPVQELVAAIKATPARHFWLEAPELLVYKEYVRELESALGPLKVTWTTHTTLRSASDEKTLRSAYRAGLRALWLGVESFSQESLNFVNKGFNRVDTYQQTFDLLDKVGVSAYCYIMVGLAKDTMDDYERTLRGLVAGKVAGMQVYVMGVYSGDFVFERKLIEAGASALELFDKDSRMLDHCFKYYKPKGFSDAQIAEAFERLFSSFFAPANMAKRLLTRSLMNLPNLSMDLFLNLSSLVSRTSPLGISWDFYQVVDEHFRLPKGTSRRLTSA